MILYIYSVYDVKSKIYETPDFCLNENVCRRNCQSAIMAHSDLKYAQFPEDFVMFQLGTFDNESGLISYADQPEVVFKFLDLFPRKKLGD